MNKNKNIKVIAYLAAAGLVIILLVLFCFKLVLPTYRLVKIIPELQANVSTVKTAAQARDFDQVQSGLVQTKVTIEKVEFGLQKLSWLARVPVAGDNYLYIATIATGAKNLVDAGEKLVPQINQIQGSLPPDAAYKDFTVPQKVKLLKQLQELIPTLQNLSSVEQGFNDELAKVNKKHLLWPLSKFSTTADPYLLSVGPSLQLASSALQALPLLAGLGTEKTYLLVMQNNDELRPTGGFIGLYGVLKIQNGNLTKLYTDDSYSLDKAAEKYLDVTPPEPIKEYMTKYWFLRDANWYPDFPTSAEKILWFYGQEKGEGNPSGVIAFDQDAVAALLQTVGPIKINDLTFDQNNFGDLLQYEVEQKYLERGLPKEDRKDIVNTLASELASRLTQLPPTQWLNILATIQQNLNEKHVLLYDRNQDLQNIYKQNNWTGEIKTVKGDYLMFVDANMVALKTDRVVDKTISYNLKQNTAGELIAIATIKYHNTGKLDYRTSRLRTYTRLYVPLGSKLIATTGAFTNDRGDNPGQKGSVDIGVESGKTYFGAFTYVKPGEEKSLIFEYQLPPELQTMASSGAYTLFVQKQPGTTGHKLGIRVNLNDSEKAINTDLSVDRSLEFNFPTTKN